MIFRRRSLESVYLTTDTSDSHFGLNFRFLEASRLTYGPEPLNASDIYHASHHSAYVVRLSRCTISFEPRPPEDGRSVNEASRQAQFHLDHFTILLLQNRITQRHIPKVSGPIYTQSAADRPRTYTG